MRHFLRRIHFVLWGGVLCLLAPNLLAQTGSAAAAAPISTHADLNGVQPVFVAASDSEADECELDAPMGPEVGSGIQDVLPLRSGGPNLDCLAPISDVRRNHGFLVTLDYDAFMSHADDGWENNGIRIGGNFASRLGRFSDRTGIGLQVGSSVGIYDWAGTGYRLQNQDQSTTQGFFTYGLYRKPDENSSVVAGLVQDWMFTDNYGVFGERPTLSQLRGQLGYAVDASNEFGLWGTAHVVSSTRNVPIFGSTTWRSINQLSLYWHHKWEAYGSDTWISAGIPQHSRLGANGSLGDYLVSASAVCPFNDVVSLYSSVTYMHPSGRPGPGASSEDAWNFSIGIAIYWGRNTRTSTVAGERWMPLLPVANNGTFLVDTNRTF